MIDRASSHLTLKPTRRHEVEMVKKKKAPGRVRSDRGLNNKDFLSEREKKTSPRKITRADALSSNQLDLFFWNETTKTKKTKCLKCGENEMILKLNEKTGIFEGNRLCKSCRQVNQSRKFIW